MLSGLLGVNIYSNTYDAHIEIEYKYQPKTFTKRSDVVQKTCNDGISFRTSLRADAKASPLEGKDIVIARKRKQNHIDQYIIDHAHLAIEVEKLYGIPAELCLAQAIHESGGGTSWLAKNANNHFGMKALKGLPYVQPKRSKWAKFASVDDAYMNYGRCVTRLINALYPKGWITITPLDIAKTAYAGKNNWDYAAKCSAIINDYQIKLIINQFRFN